MSTVSCAAEGAPQKAARRKLHYALRLTLALLMLLWLAGTGGWTKITSCLAGASLLWFGLAVLTYLAGQSLCAWKWGLLAGALGFRRPKGFYWVHYLGAMFPGLFLPTTVGGDVFRAVALSAGSDRAGAAVSVLADRGTGVLAMTWIAAVAAASLPAQALPWQARAAIFGLCGALTAGFILPFFRRPGWLGKGFVGRSLSCWDRPGPLLTAVAAALVFQALACVVYMLLGGALGLELSPAFYFVLCPIASLAAMSPVTLNGMGERTAALVLLMGLEGVGRDRAVALGLAWTALAALSSLIGGLALMCAGGSYRSETPAGTDTGGMGAGTDR